MSSITKGLRNLDGARVSKSIAISVPNSSVTTLDFNSERFDDNDLHDNSTNPERLTAKVAGRYIIFAHLRWASNGTGQRIATLKINGSNAIASSSMVPVSGSVTNQFICTIFNMAANDYVEITGFQDSGGALNVESVASASPEFVMNRLRDE